MNVIILLGPPGSGKGTISEALDKYAITHISTGKMLRREIRKGTKLGIRSKEAINNGLFANDDDVILMVKEFLMNSRDDEFFIFDGFPRTLVQANKFEELCAKTDVNISRVLSLICPSDVLIERLSGRRTCVACGAVYHDLFCPPEIRGRCDVCGGSLAKRLDDEPEKIKRRLEVYDEMTLPLVDFYKKRNLLTEIDSNCPTRSVHEYAIDFFEKVI